MNFDTFQLSHVDLGEVSTPVRHAGWGPPLLLLHGSSQNLMIWSRIAGDLAEDFTIIVPEIPGRGEREPPTRADGAVARRAMVRDAIALMAQFGFPEFYVAGHARGGRIGYRLALQHPQQVLRLSVLDMVPGRIARDDWAGPDRPAEAPRETRKIRCPLQVLWCGNGRLGRLRDPLAAWSPWAEDIRGEPIGACRFLIDERPAETLAALRRFFIEGY